MIKNRKMRLAVILAGIISSILIAAASFVWGVDYLYYTVEQNNTAVSQALESETVWIPKTGRKYHCRSRLTPDKDKMVFKGQNFRPTLP